MEDDQAAISCLQVSCISQWRLHEIEDSVNEKSGSHLSARHSRHVHLPVAGLVLCCNDPTLAILESIQLKHSLVLAKQADLLRQRAA